MVDVSPLAANAAIHSSNHGAALRPTTKSAKSEIGSGAASDTLAFSAHSPREANATANKAISEAIPEATIRADAAGVSSRRDASVYQTSIMGQK